MAPDPSSDVSEIKQNIQEVQSFMRAKNRNLSNTMESLDTLHITLGLYCLENEEVSEAKRALEGFQSSLSNFSPLTFTVSTVGNFGDQVIFAAMTENQRLKNLVEALRESFQNRGLLVTDERFNPHVTICKITGRSRDQGIYGINPSDYREKASTYFGKQHARSIQLCSMAKPRSESGYYHVEKEIYF